MSLSGFHLLVTRPQERALPWATQLQALGAEVSIQSMMRIVPLTGPPFERDIVRSILAFDHYQKAIFISQNAVTYGLQWLDQYWPQLPVGVDFFAIGQATAAQLLHNTTTTVYSAIEAMNSEALLTHPQLQSVAGEKILIFRGQGGRTLLAETLQQRGADVDYCELYTRQPPRTSPQPIEAAFRYTNLQPIATIHSGETLNHLCGIIQPNDLLWLKQQPLLLPGQRVAEQARTAGFSQLIVAKNASHNPMIEALYDWQKNR